MEESKSIKKLLNLFGSKENIRHGFQITQSDQTIQLQDMKLDPERNYRFYMKRFSVYNTLFNVDETNNKFRYTTDYTAASVIYETLVIESGAYELKQLNSEIQRLMKIKGHYDTTATGSTNPYYITFTINDSTSKTIMSITNSLYKVDFSYPNSLNTILGFDPLTYSKTISNLGIIVSEKIIQITTTNDIFIHCDWVTSNSYQNGVRSSILYSISAYSIPVGAKLNVVEPNPVYLPLTLKNIQKIRFEIKDDRGKLLNFNNEVISIELIIEQV